jgi:hypothetical protein
MRVSDGAFAETRATWLATGFLLARISDCAGRGDTGVLGKALVRVAARADCVCVILARYVSYTRIRRNLVMLAIGHLSRHLSRIREAQLSISYPGGRLPEVDLGRSFLHLAFLNSNGGQLLIIVHAMASLLWWKQLSRRCRFPDVSLLKLVLVWALKLIQNE